MTSRESWCQLFVPEGDLWRLGAAFSNARGQFDRISYAADVEKLMSGTPGTTYVDEMYGHAWKSAPPIGAAVYGKTEFFEPDPAERLSSSGEFLRVPYRRIPVLDIESVDELRVFVDSVVSADATIKVAWRGQNREHYLAREEEDTLRLYGEPVKEPSLLPSCARAGLEFDAVFPAWAALLDVYIMEHTDYLRRTGGIHVDEQRHVANFRELHNYRLWALATAQHYGLPSVGLDVTPDWRVALTFALTQFTFSVGGKVATCRLGADETPVIYAMAIFEHDLLDDRLLAPPSFECVRPRAQKAQFFGSSWGLSPNRGAERIRVALRLKKHHEWSLPTPVATLFPDISVDSFLAFLLDARSRFPELAKVAQLERVYYLAG